MVDIESIKIDIESIKKVKLEEGDVLILRTPFSVSVEAAERMKAQLIGLGITSPVVVLDSGTSLEVLSARRMEQTPEAYLLATDEAEKVALHRDGYWNERYRSALDRRGLTLSTAPTDSSDPRYPNGTPNVAPWPVEDEPDPWAQGSVVVWK